MANDTTKWEKADEVHVIVNPAKHAAVRRIKDGLLKKKTLKELDTLTPDQAKNALAFLSGHYIRTNAEEWREIWAQALKNSTQKAA